MGFFGNDDEVKVLSALAATHGLMVMKNTTKDPEAAINELEVGDIMTAVLQYYKIQSLPLMNKLENKINYDMVQIAQLALKMKKMQENDLRFKKAKEAVEFMYSDERQ